MGLQYNSLISYLYEIERFRHWIQRALWSYKKTFKLLNFAFPVLVAQIILGVWLSSNYAAFACPDFPLCQGQILPDSDFRMGFNFMQSIGQIIWVEN